jgi:hypothetical protein
LTKKDAWPNYVAFLEAAYKFSQAKISIEKEISWMLETGKW